MKLAILSRNTRLYSTRRLVEAARTRGHTVRVLDPLRCYLRIACDGFAMHYKGRPISDFDAVIPRIGASVTRYGNAVLHQFELMGAYTPNPSAAIGAARDKLRAHQILAAQGIGLPATVFGDNPDDTHDLLSMLGPPPHIIKLNEGAQGAGVMLTEKPSASRSVIEVAPVVCQDSVMVPPTATSAALPVKLTITGGSGVMVIVAVAVSVCAPSVALKV